MSDACCPAPPPSGDASHRLFRFREGDANMRSVWLCTRNDVIAILAGLGLSSGRVVIRQARLELRAATGQRAS